MRQITFLSFILAVSGMAAGAPTLPVNRVIGLTNFRTPYPFDHSDKLLVESPPGVLRVHDASGEVGTPMAVGGPVDAAVLSADDALLFAVIDDQLIALQLSNGAILRDFDLSSIQSAPAWNITTSPDGTLLLLSTRLQAGQTGSVAALTASDFQLVQSYQHVDLTRTCTISPDNADLFAVQGEKEIVRIDLGTGASSMVDFEPTGLRVNALAFRGNALLALSSTGTRQSHPLPVFPYSYEEESIANHLQKTVDGQTLWTRTLTYSPVSPTGSSAPYPAPFGGVLMPGGSHLLVYTNGLGQVVDIDSDTAVLGPLQIRFESVSRSGDKLAAAVATPAETIDLYNVRPSAGLVLSVPAERYIVRALGGPGGQFASGDPNSPPAIYDIDGQPLQALACANSDDSECDGASYGTWVPGEDLLLSGGDALRVWNTATGEDLRTLFLGTSSAYNVESIATSADGTKVLFTKYLATESCPYPFCQPSSRTLEICSTQDLLDGIEGNSVSIQPPDDESVFRPAIFSPDGLNVYAVALSRTRLVDDLLVRYSATNGQVIDAVSIVRGNPWEAPTRDSLAISPDGRRLALAVSGVAETGAVAVGSIRIYDAQTLDLLETLRPEPTHLAEFSPDGTYLIARDQSTIRLIDARNGGDIAEYGVENSNSAVSWQVIDNGATLAVPSDDTLAYLSLDIPAIQALSPREAFLTADANALARDRNGDGILDAADLVQPTILH